MAILARYEAKGYRGQFGARAGGRVVCFTCRVEQRAAGVELDALHRLEGASSPDGEAAVAAVQCGRCKAKGTLVLAYGPEAPVEEALALREMHDRRGAAGLAPGL